MNPIEILEILAIAVHSFSEMLGLRQTLLWTVQMSAGREQGWCSLCRVQPDSRPHSEDQSNIDKTEEKSEKITLCRSLYRESVSARLQLSSRSVGKLGLFLCCIELAEARA